MRCSRRLRRHLNLQEKKVGIINKDFSSGFNKDIQRDRIAGRSRELISYWISFDPNLPSLSPPPSVHSWEEEGNIDVVGALD